MSSIKAFKRGEIVFREGEKASAIYLIQSGTVSLCLARPKKNIELVSLSNPNLFGDQALQGSSTHTVTAICLTDVKAVEFPIEAFRAQVGASSQAVQIAVKSLSERLKGLTTEIRSLRLERDVSPVPEDQIARALGVAYHSAIHKGKSDGSDLVVPWLAYKQHAQRIFGESPKRLEQICSIFTKLKFATFEKAPDELDPDGPEVISQIRFSDLASIDAAVDFYQHYYFKGGRGDLLKPEDGPAQLVAAVLKCAESEAPDRKGTVLFEYAKIVERLKTEFNLNVKPDHWARLEAKGLFARFIHRDDGIRMQIDPIEFKRTLQTWRVLREIDRLNERGFVDMAEEDFAAKKKSANSDACPSCMGEITGVQKFCAHCGHRLSSVAA